jgi:hypothetical protein
MGDRQRNIKWTVTAILIVIATFAIPSMISSQTSKAQVSNNNMTGSSCSQNQTKTILGANITGSIPIGPTISKAISSQMHVSLPNATAAAEKSVGTNAHAVFARIGLVHGYLVYTILVTDNNSNFHYITIDVGNGKVLSSNQLSAKDIMPRALMMAMGPIMMVIPGMGMMIGPVMMNEPESYSNSFP